LLGALHGAAFPDGADPRNWQHAVAYAHPGAAVRLFDGAVVCRCGGAVAPLLRFALFGMPPIYPAGVAMCVEMAVYGAVSGLLYRKLPRSTVSIYVSLVAAMLLGRIVWGAARFILSGISGVPFTWAAFMAGAFTSAVPGIILHIALIPVLVLALQRALPWLKEME